MGFLRKIIKTISRKPKAPIQVVESKAPQTAVSEAPTDITEKKKLTMGSNYNSQTILTSPVGDEGEANVSKTILGGGKKKKIKA